MSNTSPNSQSKSLKQYSVQELIQIILNEEKSKKLSFLFFEISQSQIDKTEKMRNHIQDVIKSNGFEYFVDRLIEKQMFLSATVKEELSRQLLSLDSPSDCLRKKVRSQDVVVVGGSCRQYARL